MLLAVDAGNTQTVVGLFDERELVDHWRIATVVERTADELALMVRQFLAFHGFTLRAEPVGGEAPADTRDRAAAREPLCLIR